jgi:hypothetical protein
MAGKSTSSRSQKQKKESLKSIFTDEGELLKLANLTKISGERNTEHGKSLVQIIDFREEGQREKIIRMLADHYSEVLWKILPYLRELGRHPRAEIRWRAAESVGELMCEDFIRVKEEVLIPWAMHWSPIVNANVGLALEMVAKDDRYASNVKALLKHWVTVSNPDLNWTALASSVPLCSLWPEDTLEFIEKSIRRGQIGLLALSIYVIRELCRTGHTDKALARLSEWIQRKREEHALRTGAAIIFFEGIELSHISEKKALMNCAAEILLTSLEDRSLDNEGTYRSLALEMLHQWLQSTMDDKTKLGTVEKLFMQIYKRSSDRGQERLEFNVSRWSRTTEGKDAKIYQRLMKNMEI